jgi:hypothetical protein
MVWFDEDNEHEKFPKLSADEDSMLINTIRVKVERSDDSGYHAYLLKFARANTPTEAEANAEKISFPVTQKDSVLYLPEGFAITKQNKFRNQQVMVVIEVPVGKQIRIDNRTDNFDWFTVSARYRGRDRGLRVDWDEDWSRDYGYRTDVWYTMTATGLERTDKKSDDWNADENKDDNTDENNGNKDGYRYKKDKEIKIDTVDIKLKSKDTTVNIKLNTRLDSKVKKESDEEESPVRKKGAYVYHMISIFDLMRIGK